MNNTFNIETIINLLNEITEQVNVFNKETFDVYSAKIGLNKMRELQMQLAKEEWILDPEDLRSRYDGNGNLWFSFHQTLSVGNLSQGTLLDGKDSDAGVTFCREWEIRYSPTLAQWVRVDSVSEETPEPILKTR